jgi:deazaflavin-dependent oxidoreductase (nitroreductase family)
MLLRELSTLQHEKVLYLTTVGHKSGMPRTIEIWFVIHQRRFYLLAELGLKAHWVQNIQVNPRVTLRIKHRRLQAYGRVLDDVRDRQEWRAVAELSRRKYGWGEGLPVAFEVFQEEKLGR